MSKIINAHDFNCPNCEIPFTEDVLMALCNEPFNGTLVICPHCMKEFTLDLLIKIEEV